MSEILIKGMEMPKSCETCQLATVNYYNTWCPLAKCFMKRGYSFKDCPLVEVPPHGVLKDIDVINDAIIEAERLGEITGGEAGFFKAILNNAPRVIDTSKH